MPIEVISNAENQKAVQVVKDKVAENSEIENTKSASSESDESELQDENSEASDTSEKTDEDEADSSESDNDEGLKDESKEDKPKKQNKLSKRIGKLTADREFARREALEAKLENQRLREELQKSKTPEEQIKVNQESEGEPDPDKFETTAEYLKALAKHEIAKEKKALAKESHESRLKNEYQKQLESHNKRVEEFKSKQPDYEQVVEDFLEEHGDLRLSPALEDCILSSDLGPAAFYELLKDKKSLDKFNSLPRDLALREFGKLEARLEKSSEKPKEVKVTKAPPPISPVSSKNAATIKKSIFDSDLTQAEYEAIRRADRKRAQAQF